MRFSWCNQRAQKPEATTLAKNQAGTTARGYGSKHQAERRLWDRKVKAGKATCVRCGKNIEPGQHWDLDHTEDRTGYLGPAHRSCNRSAGGRNGAATTNAKKLMTTRDW